jgi:hypothetical protein
MSIDCPTSIVLAVSNAMYTFVLNYKRGIIDRVNGWRNEREKVHNGILYYYWQPYYLLLASVVVVWVVSGYGCW